MHKIAIFTQEYMQVYLYSSGGLIDVNAVPLWKLPEKREFDEDWRVATL